MDDYKISWTHLNVVMDRYKKADLLSVKVGMVLIPLFFLGAAVISLIFLPQSLNLWLVPALVVACGLLMWFVIRYNKRTKTRPGYVIETNHLEFLTIGSNSLDRAYVVKVKIVAAFAVTPNGRGKELEELRNTTSNKAVIGYHLYEAMKTHQPRYIVCVPGGPCVGFLVKEGFWTVKDKMQRVHCVGLSN